MVVCSFLVNISLMWLWWWLWRAGGGAGGLPVDVVGSRGGNVEESIKYFF